MHKVYSTYVCAQFRGVEKNNEYSHGNDYVSCEPNSGKGILEIAFCVERWPMGFGEIKESGKNRKNSVWEH